ncbi:uncharacterized protein K452DRAFT_331927 [Aplosporella prunicola CBS 121167]|uniref:Large ribosomal subunit protein uL6 alpha-beta domain-containing protein n=1 Tax=Aplosporella prunicola CBS 121167 TaxID=1176127 RepID=A0A6A6AV33_9PEZI|nr:uncharacterized protein K452DRAFT_331927 [Aplosporella prunicola CBS 121167]KAF2135456.1 hypothetical protein K452DRAFT_331927 [Aplosporella prunicola CBS 121167]
MFSTARRRCVHACVASNARAFSVSAPCASKIGRAPLSLPPEVTLEVLAPPAQRGLRVSRDVPLSTAVVKGPLGELSMSIPPFVRIERATPDSPPTIQVLKPKQKEQREMWGTIRAYLQNNVLGVSEGHTAILRLVGVGYRATVEKEATTVQAEFPGQQFVNLKVGFTHPVELPIPMGVKASTPQPTRILLEGVDKVAVMSFAAKIRAWRKPEPYKGKGIFVNGETIKLKSKKIK